jgi:F420-0:gamma-glutamyl ligase-like protein
MKFYTFAIKCKYWRPGCNFLNEILKEVNKIKHLIKDGDILVLSEKALSTALNLIIDESKVKPSFSAKFLAKFWVRIIWGFILGPLCRLSLKNLFYIRSYPIKEGALHKQLAISYAGLIQALKVWSEGGIDVTNLPYAYASLPLKNPEETAEKILNALKMNLKINKKIGVLIVDSDKTFSFRCIHLSSRKTCFKGLINLGPLAYIIGRIFKWKPRSTPIALKGFDLSLEEALQVSAASNKARKSGAGKTIWEASRLFNTGLTNITWEMLEKIPHYPIVLIRKIKA